MMHPLTRVLSFSAFLILSFMTAQYHSVFAADPAVDEFDENLAAIRSISMSRGQPHPEASKSFRGSRNGGVLYIIDSPAALTDAGVDEAALQQVRFATFPLRRDKDRVALKLSQDNFDLADKKLSPDELKVARSELLKQFYSDVQGLEDKYLPELKMRLKDEQWTRLVQIAMQAFGSWDLVADPELASTLDLTQEQLTKITGINEEYRHKVLTIYLNGPRMPIYKRLELSAERDSKAVECLSKEQQEKYKEILGKPFKVAFLSMPEAWRATTEVGGSGRQTPAILSTFENNGIINLAENMLVQKELGLSDDLIAKVSAVKEQFATAWEQAGGRARPGIRTLPDGKSVRFRDAIPPTAVINLMGDRNQSDDEFKQRMEKQRELWNTTTAKFLAQLKELMTADQFTRLQQIYWQHCGVVAFSDPEIIQSLAVTDEQKQKITSELDQYLLQLRTSSGVRADDDSRKKMAESLKQRDAKITEVMTKQQLDQFAAMKGKPFHFPLAGAAPARLFKTGLHGGLFSIVRNATVQQELEMDQDTEIKVEAIKEQFSEAWYEAGGGFRIRNVTRKAGGISQFQEAAMPPWGLRIEPGLTVEQRSEKVIKMMNQWRVINDKYVAELKNVLTAEQYTRLKQIVWQAMGSESYSDPELIAALSITKEQLDKLAAAHDEYRQKNQQLTAQGAGDGGGPSERNEKLNELGEKLKELSAEQEIKLNSILTQAQLDQFNTLKGKEFDISILLEADQPNGPRRGRPAGGL